MLAIFLSKNMDPFYQNISSFPTAIYTVLLATYVVYWAGAVIGMFDIDIINVDTDFSAQSSARWNWYQPSDATVMVLPLTIGSRLSDNCVEAVS